MRPKKLLFIILAVVSIGILLFGLMIYATIKTKSTDVSNEKPFQEWVGKSVSLKQPIIIFNPKIKMYKEKDYPYEFLDSLHPNWQSINEQLNSSDSDVEEIDRFSSGSSFTIEKATMFTNGVSGSSYPYVFGIITDGSKTYKVGFQWGGRSLVRFMDGVDKQWQFPQAPWQNQTDTTYYALPEAEWW